MTKAEKLLQRIRNNPRQVSFDDLDKVLRNCGFISRGSGGGSSHVFYWHPEFPKESVTVPHRRPHVLIVYVLLVLAMIDRIAASKSDQGGAKG